MSESEAGLSKKQKKLLKIERSRQRRKYKDSSTQQELGGVSNSI